MPHDPNAEPAPLADRLAQSLPRLRAHLARRGAGLGAVDADDLAQEVVARALRYGGRFDPARALWPWLRRLANGVVADQRAAASRAPATSDGLEPPHVDAPVLGDEVARALAPLTPVQREVVLRFHRNDETIEEIAAALAMPAGTVKSHLHRARSRLAGLEDTEAQR